MEKLKIKKDLSIAYFLGAHNLLCRISFSFIIIIIIIIIKDDEIIVFITHKTTNYKIIKKKKPIRQISQS